MCNDIIIVHLSLPLFVVSKRPLQSHTFVGRIRPIKTRALYIPPILGIALLIQQTNVKFCGLISIVLFPNVLLRVKTKLGFLSILE